MNIEILGMGCAKCRLLEENVRTALGTNGKNVEVVKAAGMDQILGHDVMPTSALAIGGKVKYAGRIPYAVEIAEWLTE